MIIVQNKFSKWILLNGYVAVALFPFLLIRPGIEVSARLINHERIHFRQQIEMLLIGFYLWYLIEFLLRLIRYRSRRVAYRGVLFEKEAYSNEADPEYLKSRKLYDWLR